MTPLIIVLSLDPITSLDVTGRLVADVECDGGCQVEASVRYAHGETIATYSWSECHAGAELHHLPFGARLVPHASATCRGKLAGSIDGRPVTIAPYLTNVELDGTSVWVPALAEPRGPERVRLHAWSPTVDIVRDFDRNELVLRGVDARTTLHVRATLEPYGIASNERTVKAAEPSLHVEAESGCAVTPLCAGLVFFRRRRFTFVRPIC